MRRRAPTGRRRWLQPSRWCSRNAARRGTRSRRRSPRGTRSAGTAAACAAPASCLVAGAVLRLLLHQGDDAVGLDRPGAKRDHADAVARADAAERLRERREGGIAGDAADIFRIVRVGGVADHVDDDAGLARLHQRIEARGTC